MRIGVRGRFFLVPFLAILVVLLAAGAYLVHALRVRVESEIETELVRLVGLSRALVETAPALPGVDEADALADRMGGEAGARVTLVAADGRVLGDSDLTPAQVRAAENHGGRPEIAQARAEGLGKARRHSATIGADMLYVAAPFHRIDGDGLVRVALPLARVDRAVWRLRLLILAVGAAAAGFAALTSRAASGYLVGTMRRLIESARRVAPSDAEAAAAARDDLAGSIQHMARELQRTVEDLAAARDRFQEVLLNMGDAVLALDGARRVVVANGAARALFGIEGDPTGRPLLESVRHPALMDLLQAARAGSALDEFEVGRTARRRVLARATPLRAGGGTVVVLHDVTELRHLETVRRDFVANVSHELRTPVSIIRANAETLLGGALDDADRGRGFLEAIARHADRLGRLIADLLDVSMIEAGRYPLEPGAIEVAAPVRRVVALLDRQAREKDLEVSVRVPEGLTAYADAEALEQVLLNLLENAVKYSAPGGHVVVAASASDGSTRLSVADDGPGIEPAHRDRLFERFYRVDPGRSREMGGTGLGLAIAKHLVGAMGGRIGMEPAAPHGSVFWILLPREGPAAP